MRIMGVWGEPGVGVDGLGCELSPCELAAPAMLLQEMRGVSGREGDGQLPRRTNGGKPLFARLKGGGPEGGSMSP